MIDEKDKRRDAHSELSAAIESIKTGDARGYMLVVFDKPGEHASAHAGFFGDGESRGEVVRGARRFADVIDKLL